MTLPRDLLHSFLLLNVRYYIVGTFEKARCTLLYKPMCCPVLYIPPRILHARADMIDDRPLAGQRGLPALGPTTIRTLLGNNRQDSLELVHLQQGCADPERATS